MAAMVLNLAVEQGATFSQEITTAPVINLTGYTGKCQIRATASHDSPVVAEPTITLNADPTTGKFTISMTAVQTAGIPCTNAATYASISRFVFDIEMTSGTTVLRVCNGSVTVSPEVTRS